MAIKQYLGLIRDHSGSMGHLTQSAMRDYNENLQAIKDASRQTGIETITTVLKCGVGYRGDIINEQTNKNVQGLQPISQYIADGSSTPLFDSVGKLIDEFSTQDVYSSFDRNFTNSYLIVATTDGENNRHEKWSANKLADAIKRLQATDRWSFVFRVPYGYKDNLVRVLGVHPGNVLEWEQSEQGIERSLHQTRASYDTYYSGAWAGSSSTQSFFVDPNTIPTNDLKVNLVDISHKVTKLSVWPGDAGRQIREFVETTNKIAYILGNAYYELTKTETLQPQKDIIVYDTKTGHMYQGHSAARELLGLPSTGNAKIIPSGTGHKKIFVQSTSVNRKLVGDTLLLIFNK